MRLGLRVGDPLTGPQLKKIIAECIALGRPVITATQMLESMITNPRPTRAEASDVANAIYDRSSAVMMSAETASGKYPVRAARIMSRIIRRSERDVFTQWQSSRRRRSGDQQMPVSLATVRAAAYASVLCGARLVAVFSESGRYVVFHSGATNLVTGDTNNQPDVFLRYYGGLFPTTTRISVTMASEAVSKKKRPSPRMKRRSTRQSD